MTLRRNVMRSIFAIVATGAWALVQAQTQAGADDYPNKPIRLLVATAPGALADQAARLYADRMSAYLKQPIVVENIAGAASILATRQLLRAAPDGYTLMHVSNTTVTAVHLNRNAGYSLKDFAPIGEMVRSPSLMVVSSQSRYRSLPELVAAARKAPGEVSYGSGGVGATNHLPVELFARQAGVKFTHAPYKGIAMAVPDVVANRIDFMISTSTSTGELMRSGALRPIAITADSRSSAFPQVPTMRELGYSDGTYEIWLGLVTRAGVPQAVLSKLADAMQAARNDTSLMQRLEVAGQFISGIRTPQEFQAVLRSEDEKYGKLIKDLNLTVE